MEYLDKGGKLSEDQHGFRSGRSCVNQFLEIVEVWTSMLDEGAQIDVLYLDFWKAFDSVPHQRLGDGCLLFLKAFSRETDL